MPGPLPRTLKGFRDFLPEAKAARDRVETRLVETFQRHGFQPLETPTLEYAELILGKYGAEADRLVYAFDDRGGRRVALPYDQTVPAARVLAQYRTELPRYFRRYAVGNVFRAENPQRGRYREFKQCDIDIYGSASPVADAEILACTDAAFRAVGFARPRILVNDRRVLVATLEPFATDAIDVFTIIRAIDKLDKQSEDDVLGELVQKGLQAARASEALAAIRQAAPSTNLAEILDAARTLGVPADALVYTPTLARGLDYYTGAIFEVAVEGFTAGSLAGGGRYDGLLEALGGPPTPAVGLAFGFDRMVEAAAELALAPPVSGAAHVLVTIFDEERRAASLEVAAALRAAGIACEVHPGEDKLGRQFKLADQKGIPWVVIVGPDEQAAGTVTLRDMKSGAQTTVARAELAAAVAQRLKRPV